MKIEVIKEFKERIAGPIGTSDDWTLIDGPGLIQTRAARMFSMPGWAVALRVLEVKSPGPVGCLAQRRTKVGWPTTVGIPMSQDTSY